MPPSTTPGAEENVVTEMQYGPGGQLAALIAKNPATGDQVTRYLYTVLRSHLRALVEALKLAPVGVPVHVMSACRDWANVQGDPVRNRDLLEQISRLRRRPIEFEQVDREEIDARIDAVKIQQARPIPVPDLRRPSDPPRPTMRSAAPLAPLAVAVRRQGEIRGWLCWLGLHILGG